MIQFDKFLSRHKDFSAMKLQAAMTTGVSRAMDKGRRSERMLVDGAPLTVSYDRTNMSDMIRVRVENIGGKMVGEAFYYCR